MNGIVDGHNISDLVWTLFEVSIYRPTNTKVGRKVTNGHVSTHTKHETQHLWQWMQKHFKQHMGIWSYAKFKMDAINIRTHVRNDVFKK